MLNPPSSDLNATQCDVCNETIAAFKCEQCHQFMCGTCRNWHKKFASTKGHDVVDLNQAQYTDAVNEVIGQLSETRRKLRDAIENTARKQKSVETNVTAVKTEIGEFETMVKNKCTELYTQADEKGHTLLTELDSQLQLLVDGEGSIGTHIDEVSKLLDTSSAPQNTDLTLIQIALKSHEEDNAKINKTLLDKDDGGLEKLEFFAPCEGRNVTLHMHAHRSERGDSGFDALPACCTGSDVEDTEPEYEIPRSPECSGSPAKSEAAPKSPTDAEKPSIPPRPDILRLQNAQETTPSPKVPLSAQVPLSPLSIRPPQTPLEAPPPRSRDYTPMGPSPAPPNTQNFSHYVDKILDHSNSIDEHQSCFLSIILGEVWIVASSIVHVYGLSMDHIRSMHIQSLTSHKKGVSPQACAQNRNGQVFIAFNRSQVSSRHTMLNGIWTIHQCEGHVVDKLSGGGGYVNVVCSDTAVIGLCASLDQITVHKKTGERAVDWTTTVLPLNVRSADVSLLAHNDCMYFIDKNSFVRINPQGKVTKRLRFPTISDASGGTVIWHLCSVDPEGRIILCEQIMGRVFIYNTDGHFTRIHFTQKDSDLENPTQVISDSDGNVWVHEQTVYGDMISKFLLQ